jgi:cellulose synthase/poly-beta-1,6-N-acetylglucosamine synthase-like glycosyltransferase
MPLESQASTIPGVSIVIPCHNGAPRLPVTLEHLAAQKVSEGTRWEVILVDNASTDETAATASRCWPVNHRAPLRIVQEPRLGSRYARERGLAEAQFEVVSFVDDDNWVCDSWVQVLTEVMHAHPEVGLCGGFSADAYEVPPPAWWVRRFTASMVGTDPACIGDVTNAAGLVQGAGMSARVSAYRGLHERGFMPLSAGRVGADTSGGEDFETCFAMRLAGWRLWVEPRLTMKHFIPRRRLNWEYARQLQRGSAISRLTVEPYEDVISESGIDSPRASWNAKAVALAGAIARTAIRHPIKTASVALFARCPEGDFDCLRIEGYLARWRALFAARHTYDDTVAAIAHAPWRRV